MTKSLLSYYVWQSLSCLEISEGKKSFEDNVWDFPPVRGHKVNVADEFVAFLTNFNVAGGLTKQRKIPNAPTC